jgi:hypothetical protein
MAQRAPVVTDDPPVVIYRDSMSPSYRLRWQALTSPIPLRSGATRIDVHDRRPYTQLRLQTRSGSTRVDRVVVRFENGGRQVVDVNRRLDPNKPAVDIDLRGDRRRVDSIVVMSDSRRGARMQVFGI